MTAPIAAARPDHYVQVLGLASNRPGEDIALRLADATPAELRELDQRLQVNDVDAYLASVERRATSSAPDDEPMVFDDRGIELGPPYLEQMPRKGGGA